MSGDGTIAFTGPSGGRAVSVTGELSSMVFAGDVLPQRRPLPDAAQVPAPQAALIGLPRRPAATFVGRDQALDDLHATLTAGTGRRLITQAVIGLGGVGKTELALQHAHHHRDSYRLVWWIDADTSGPEHPTALAAWHDLAHYWGMAGDAAAARDQLAALLPAVERVLGADHPNALTTRYYLGHWIRRAEEEQ